MNEQAQIRTVRASILIEQIAGAMTAIEAIKHIRDFEELVRKEERERCAVVVEARVATHGERLARIIRALM